MKAKLIIKSKKEKLATASKEILDKLVSIVTE